MRQALPGSPQQGRSGEDGGREHGGDITEDHVVLWSVELRLPGGFMIMKISLSTGTNQRTKKEGDFPLDSLYILPILSKPSNDILVIKR